MKNSIFVLIVLSTLQLFAHGEDKPGPHGGRIEMAKNVHTEVAADKDGSFHIFLLDGNMENPTVKNSSIEASIKSDKKDLKLQCALMGGTHFHCRMKEKRPTTGALFLKAKRDNVDVEVKYDLAIFNEGASSGDHTGH